MGVDDVRKGTSAKQMRADLLGAATETGCLGDVWAGRLAARLRRSWALRNRTGPK